MHNNNNNNNNNNNTNNKHEKNSPLVLSEKTEISKIVKL